MDKYRPCPSIIAMFTSDNQHPPRSRHAVYLGASGICSVGLIEHVCLLDQICKSNSMVDRQTNN